MVPRYFYITFYILYLISLAIALWFLLYYSGVPGWVWILFGTAILMEIMCVFIKEILLKQTLTTPGEEIISDSSAFWLILYIILYLAVFILFIIGLAFVIKYSSIPWWVWVILAVAIFCSIVGNIIYALAPGASIFGALFSISAFILFIAGIVLLIIYSNSPLWVWSIIALVIIFNMLAGIFEATSERNQTVVEETYPVKVKQVVITQTENVSLLPSSSIPEQVIR